LKKDHDTTDHGGIIYPDGHSSSRYLNAGWLWIGRVAKKNFSTSKFQLRKKTVSAIRIWRHGDWNRSAVWRSNISDC